MRQMVPGWELAVERGPDCLFVSLKASQTELDDQSELAESIWQLAQQHFATRLVLECDSLPSLNSHLIGELIRLKKRFDLQGGMLRVCGLSAKNQEVLRLSRLEGELPTYRDRFEAIGFRPPQPR